VVLAALAGVGSLVVGGSVSLRLVTAALGVVDVARTVV
jgi:hypothetical protein